MTIAKYDVWFDNMFKTWCVTAYDADGNTVGASEFSHLKSSAITSAKEHGVPVDVYDKNGNKQRTI